MFENLSNEELEKRKEHWKMMKEAKERQRTRDELLAMMYKNGASVSSLSWYFRMNESTVLSRLFFMGLLTEEEAGMTGYNFYKNLYYGE